MLIHHDDPVELLELINAELRGRDLKPFGMLDGGPNTPRIIGVEAIHADTWKYLTDVVYVVEYPGGRKRQYTIRYHNGGVVHDGMICVVLINNLLAVVRQFRLTKMAYTHELVRGFPSLENRDESTDLTELVARRLLRRELGKKLVDQAKVRELKSYGTLDADTGVSRVQLEYCFVRLEVDRAVVRDRVNNPIAGVELKTWRQDTLQRKLFRELRDIHSLAGMEILRREGWL